MDLLTYLQRYEPEELVHYSGNTYTTRTHDSLKISNGKWCWWSRGIGGTTALDYLVAVRGLSLPDAVTQIIQASPMENRLNTMPITEYKPQPFQLPSRNADNRRSFSYLRSRGVDPEIINHCIKHGLLYEDAEHHNCVFVGYDGEEPKYAAFRSSASQSAYMGDVPGSDKRYAFSIPKQAGNNEALCVFESAIDALSYLTLIKLNGYDWHDANCLSLAGIYQPKGSGEMKFPLALEQYLKDNPHIEKVILCLDNDAVGRMAAQAIRKRLEPAYTVIDNPPRVGKDYNDQLQAKKGITGVIKTRGDAR